VSRRAGALAVAALCACAGTTGTVTVKLATAPDSHVLDAALTLRLTVIPTGGAPRQVIEATRSANGFDLALDLDASGTTGALIVEGLDGGGKLVACGQSPPFPVAAITARIVVYMAAPLSVALAPIGIGAPRSEVTGTRLDYGVVLAGGRDTTGVPSTAIGIYNAYDHSYMEGAPLPAARAGVSLATGNGGAVYLFGGTGPDNTPTGTLWRFDTNLAPRGGFSTLAERTELARTGQLMVTLAPELYLVTGTPPLQLKLGTLTTRGDLPTLPATGAAGFATDGTPTAVFADSQLVRYHQDVFDVLAGDGRRDAAAARLPGGKVVVLGGGSPPSRDALVIDTTTGEVAAVANVLATARVRPSVVATSRYVVVAGGTDTAGAPVATAEVLDATTLAPVATPNILPRTGALAIALPNDQVLLAGGTPASGDIELFTPDPPPQE
jgi:hypothetical protein